MAYFNTYKIVSLILIVSCYRINEASSEPTVVTSERPPDGEDKEGVTFTKLNNAFQKYIAFEPDLDEQRNCDGVCEFDQTKVYDCQDEDTCTDRLTCNGEVFDCNGMHGAAICPSNDTNSRYDAYYEDAYKSGSKSCNDKVGLYSTPTADGICEYCLCTCQNAGMDSDLYFNLRPVVSNVKLNHVITGVRFQKVNHIIHIQIQEGELLPEGAVASAEWKPVDNYTVHDKHIVSGVDYHKLSWGNGRTVLLDRLDSPKKVMTGIRFDVYKGHLRLRMKANSFDFKSGNLTSFSLWDSSSFPFEKRTEVKLKTLKFSPDSDKADQSQSETYRSGFFKFYTSNEKFDAGQSTIPYIDIGEVKTAPTSPASGAGLILRNNVAVGPILALELLVSDFSSND